MGLGVTSPSSPSGDSWRVTTGNYTNVNVGSAKTDKGRTSNDRERPEGGTLEGVTSRPGTTEGS